MADTENRKVLFPSPFLFIVLLHLFVQPFTHFIQKVSTAIILTPFHIRISTVTIPNVDVQESAYEGG